MTYRAAALLLVLTLTGTPVAGAACLALCGSPGATQAGCHEGPEDPHDGPGLVPAHRCDLSLLTADVSLGPGKRVVARGAMTHDLPLNLGAPVVFPVRTGPMPARPPHATPAGASLSPILRI